MRGGVTPQRLSGAMSTNVASLDFTFFNGASEFFLRGGGDMASSDEI